MLEPGEPVLLEREGAVFALIRRSEPLDAITPYGYGGPVGADLPGFWREYDTWCSEGGVVTTPCSRHHASYARQNSRTSPPAGPP